MFAAFGSRLRLRLAVSVVFVVLVYNEWLSHTLSRQDWVDLPSSINNDDHGSTADDGQQANNVRLLLVADPQIQGFTMEPPGMVGWLTRWDADRFLKNSFASVFSFVEPDVILFLGDLTDEGSIASEKHFDEYKTRFLDLFRVPDTVKVINIPGDNDIGGEGLDQVTEEKSRRFRNSFGQESYVQHRFVEFIKINLLKTALEEYKDIPAKQQDRVRILVTHIPLLPLRDSNVQKIVNQLNPDLVISAHEHVARLMESGRDSVRLRSIDSMEQKGRVWRIDSRTSGSNGGLYEIQVPTCSYRMGVPRSGYGAAVISSNGRVEYTVLWLPGRFPQLYVYLAVIAFILILFLPLLFYQCWVLGIQSCLGVVAKNRQYRSLGSSKY